MDQGELLVSQRCRSIELSKYLLPFLSSKITPVGLIIALVISVAVMALPTVTPVSADPGRIVLWGVTGVNFCSAGDYSEVFKVDTSTGEVTIIAAVTDGSLYSDITETPNGNLYTVGMDKDGNTGSTDNFHDFYRLDPDTGAIIGNWTGVISDEVNALYAESDTSLLAIEVGVSYDPELLRINLDESGDYESITAIGTLPSGLISGGDLAQDTVSGKWYAAFGPNTDSEIWEVDIENPGNSVKASDSGITGVAGLAFYSDGTVYTGSWHDKNLYTLNITGGGHSVIHTDLDLSGNIFGLSSDFCPPAAPANLVVLAEDTQAHLYWTDNSEPDLAGYNVYRGETSGGPYTQVNPNTVTASQYSDTGLASGVDYYYMVTALDVWNNESGNSNEASTIPASGEGCFIATAAYGTPMAEEIDVLRDFRDQYLLTNPVGEALVELYYNTSPPVADFISEHPALKQVVRTGLEPAIAIGTVVVDTTLTQKIAILSSMGLLSALLVVWLRRRAGNTRGNAD